MLPNLNKSILKSKRWVAPSKRKDYIKIDLNENYDLFDNKNFLRKFKSFDKFIFSSYPEYEKLLTLLSKYTKQPTKNIALTNGADQAIGLVLRLFFDKGDKVVLPSPVFSIYDHVFETMEVNTNHIPYKDKNKYFEFPFEEVMKSLKQAKGLILCNPNNPLGSIIQEDHLMKLIQATNEINIPCIIDEAYFEFYGKTSAFLLNKYKNLIIIRTFSKMFGLAGLRLGYILSNEQIIEQILKIRGPWDVNHFAVFVAEIVLKNKSYFKKKLNTFVKVKQNLYLFFQNNNIPVYHTYTNFLIIKINKNKQFINKLKQNKILVNSVEGYPHNFGLLNNAVRITIPSKKDLNIIKTKLHQILKNG